MYSLILHGRRLVELRQLRVTVQKPFAFFSSASAGDLGPRVGRKGKNFTVSYLVDSLGLTTKLAESISKKVSFEDKSNPDSVLNLLRVYGFTDSQISSIITDYPRLFMAYAEKTLAPKLQFLQSRGASSSELTEIVSTVPKILGKKGDQTISRYYDFVKVIIEADKSSKICHSLPEGSKQENKIRNLLVLRELGVSQRLLFSLLTSNAKYVCGKERFQESFKKVVEMGFDPSTSKFLVALRVVFGLREVTIEEKVTAYEKLGVGVSDVWEMFKKWPSFLGYSEKKIVQTFETLKKCGLLEEEIPSVFKKCPQCIGASEQKILNSIETFIGLGFSRDEFAKIAKIHPKCIGYSAETVKKKTVFLVEKMNWPLREMALFPTVLGYSMKKRIVPRCNVIKALMSKGLLRSQLPPMSSVLACTDEAFLNRYVRNHDDKELVPELMAIFSRGRVS
ncbi:PREDICTED: transcription termination factor MTERF4, chloroplastic-like [Camelina sativa]|uniref:Transcription termination factor MTERF4, chloroplastic-like n=1 Tax=Camelina sativa TaxID=90675 RepID=A0ABM0TRP7_CAMSA|nr:PREDICTED: transcription termination factor MTERF4, chloroplastic-like [Camelina sativa]